MVKEDETQKVTPVYVRSKEHEWIPALQLKVYDGKAKIAIPVFKDEQDMIHSSRTGKQRYRENEEISLKDYPNGVLPMQNVDANGRLEEYKDMVELPFMHEAAILYNLKLRHMKERPYTRTGDILIAVNPYQWYSELYTEKKRAYYSNRLVWEPSDQDPRGVMEPHVYEVSALSYKGLAMGGEDQSILVSGESGAGKTETVKICLNHIASVQRGQVPAGYYEDSEFDPVVQRVVDSNPLLEAFGNAQTRRNDNSSRFGKYLQLQFDRNAKNDFGSKTARCGLVGSRCEVYLLEKNRVVNHDAKERTFHIFYQLLAAPDKDKAKVWEGLVGKNNESFSYVGLTSVDTIEGVKDYDRYQQTIGALDLVGVRGEKLNMLLQALCIVLQLGQLGFTEKDGDADQSKVSTKSELKALATLMGVAKSDLAMALTERSFETKKEVHKVPLSAQLAQEARDALAKEAYQKVFLWLVQAINDATAAQGSGEKTFGIIGLLDIFGFEAFKFNRFEQLCINYANEKLQQKFNEDIFANVKAEYEAEGLALDEIWYDDNTDVLDLIEGPTGLLALLNEECVRPKGNDQAFVRKALQINKASPSLIENRTDQLSFGIHHYAGGVMYDAEFFVTRNLDTLPQDLQQCAEKCSNGIISSPRSEPHRISRPRVRRGNNDQSRESVISAPTVWTKYRNQLTSLMADLRMTSSRYIRCIKPNSKKAPYIMEHTSVTEQLRCAGVVAGITISRSTFPNRLDNAVVLARYSGMWDKKKYPSKRRDGMSHQQKRAEDCKALLKGALHSKEIHENGKRLKAFVVGKTKTYFRAGALEWLEANRMKGLDSQAITIQRAARGWLARNRGSNEKQKKRFEEQERKNKERMLDEQRENHKRELGERKVRYEQEKQKMMDQIAALEKQLEKSDLEKEEKIQNARNRVIQLEQEKKELEGSHEEAIQTQLKYPMVTKVQLERKVEEAKKMIEFLKKENKKVRKEHLKLQGKVEKYQTNQEMLEQSTSSLGCSFSDLNHETKKVDAEYHTLVSTVDSCKAENKQLKTQVTKAQDQYMEQAQARLELQKTMARILTLVQEEAKDPQIVEDVVVTALEAEAEAKSIMAALDAETSEPALIGSDVSETEWSEHSYQ